MKEDDHDGLIMVDYDGLWWITVQYHGSVWRILIYGSEYCSEIVCVLSSININAMDRFDWSEIQCYIILNNSYSRQSLPHWNFENEWITSSALKDLYSCMYILVYIYVCVCNIATHQTWYKREHWLSEVTWFHDVHNPSRPHLQHGLLVLLFCRLSYVIPLVLKRTLSVSVQICQPSTQEQPAIGWPCMPNVAGLHIKRKGHCRTFLHRSVSMWLCVPVPEGHAVPRAYSAQSS